MKKMKHLFAGFVIGVVMAFAPSCGGTKPCNSTTCATGCCDAKGECQAGSSNGACGQLGGTCQICQIAQACSLGTCSQTNGNGGGTSNGGGSGGGSGGGAVTGGGGGVTGGGGGTTGGGTGGGGGVTGGGGGTCDGCIFQGGCIIRANSNNNTLCGQGGVQCATCSSPQTCQNYVCSGTATGGGGGVTGGGGGTTGGGGGTTGVVGATCTSNTQCSGLGSGAYCKLQTTPFGSAAPSAYPSGFCTLACAGTCPGTAVCAGGVSSYPYLFNEVDRFCTPACTSTANCTTGFQCLPVEPLSMTSPRAGCFLNVQTGGTFTGGGNPTKAGNPCTASTDCANPPDPILASCQTGIFTNGYCVASSDLAPPDSWCTNGGKTEIGFPLADGGTDYFCLGTCTTPGSAGTSRTGYTCFKKSTTEPTVGVLWPKCTSSTSCTTVTGMTACNTTTGFCCDTATGTVNCRFSLAP